jgi:hypothetical protein
MVEEVCVDCLEDANDLAALELLRDLPHLRDLNLIGGWGFEDDVALPAFIPPSLKTLTLECIEAPLLETLMQFISSTSGAGLEEVRLKQDVRLSAEAGAALARAFRTCSSTLKTVHIFSITDPGELINPAVASEVALGLVSCCEGLERLHVPGGVFSSLPPTCPAFTRLTHLHLFESREAETFDLASPIWGLVASELLPVLTDFSFIFTRLWWGKAGEGGEGGCRMERSLEAVAGTLRRLSIHFYAPPDLCDEVSYELGVAIGKMRHLTHLSLSLSENGRSYQAMGRGMAASGGCPPLFELEVYGVKENAILLACEPSLIVPSVRELHVSLEGKCPQDEGGVLQGQTVSRRISPHGVHRHGADDGKTCASSVVSFRSSPPESIADRRGKSR